MSPKVSFFVWEATWSKVLTLDHLKMRGWSLANKSFLCQEEKEFINHLLFHYVNTRVLWHLLFSLFRVQWVLPYTVRDTLFRLARFFCR